MSRRKIILLVVALLIAAGTMMMARSQMTKGPKEPGGTPTTEAAAPVEILVAARNLPAGTLLKEMDMKWQTWPADAVSSNLFIKDKAKIGDVAGSVVRYGLQSGEPLMAGRIMKPNEHGFLAAVLGPGMRAISIPITPVGGVAGLIFPGDRVDVIVTHEIRSGSGEEIEKRRVSETVLTDVRVLALDQKTDDQSTEPKIAETATLEVNPKQAEKIALITALGTLSLIIRAVANLPEKDSTLSPPSLDGIRLDADELGISGYTWDSDVSQVLPKPKSGLGDVRRVKILRGKEESDVHFD
jgi:pilus assembly protein CpaB